MISVAFSLSFVVLPCDLKLKAKPELITCFEGPVETAHADVVDAGQSDRFLDQILADDTAKSFLDIFVPGFFVTLELQASFPQTRVHLLEQN